MFALVDGNCFFVSCERVLQPWLNGIPVGVMSNNDGCIIARSNELKALGVPMGAPVFKWKSVLEQNKVVLFSTNFALYGDFSRRMMNILKQLSPAIEVYSIDEAFVDLKGLSAADLNYYAQGVQQKIKQWIGIPVGIGVAPTKSLAKVANKLAKVQSNASQICILNETHQIESALKVFPITDVWGIGRRLGQRMNSLGIHTALDFINQPIEWVSEHFTINEQRIHQELKGIPCLELETSKPRKSICTARSFGQKLKDKRIIAEALSHFVIRCSEKLRKQNSVCKKIHVFLQTNPFQNHQKTWHFAKEADIIPTDDSRVLIQAVLKLLDGLHQPNQTYKKAGVVLMDFADKNSFSNLYQDVKSENLMLAFDRINTKYGRDTIKIAHQGLNQKSDWRMNQHHLSHTQNQIIEIMI